MSGRCRKSRQPLWWTRRLCVSTGAFHKATPLAAQRPGSATSLRQVTPTTPGFRTLDRPDAVLADGFPA